MVNLLDTYIRKEIAKGFRGRLMPGVLFREVPINVNSSGDPVPGPSPLTFSVQGIRENFRADFAASAGIPLTDVRILLILGLIKPTTTPVKDDKIRMRGEDGTQKWHQVRAVLSVDPANASIALQCFEIPAPAGAP